MSDKLVNFWLDWFVENLSEKVGEGMRLKYAQNLANRDIDSVESLVANIDLNSNYLSDIIEIRNHATVVMIQVID